MKKVIYTVMIGDIDLLRDPVVYDDSIDYICFSDRPHPELKVWKVRHYVSGVVGNDRKRSRIFKICPHRFLQEYDVSLYIDANMGILSIPNFEEILGNNKISVKVHDRRNNISDEADICIRGRLDNIDKIINQMKTYKELGIDTTATRLYDCGVIFRYHNDLEVIKCGEEWWSNLCKHSCRDQLSFPIAFSKTKITDLPLVKFLEIVKRYRHKKMEEAKLYGFMHICTANQWKIIVIDQLEKMRKSGLYDRVETIYCGVVGDGDISFLKSYKKVELAYVSHEILHFEFLTLEFLHNFCKNNYSSKVFYIHTKGISTYGKVSNPPSPARQENIDDWRRCMEYYLIQNYQFCIDELDISDLVGIDWRGKGTNSIITPQVESHFSGNFWWARASYIALLGEVRGGPNKRCNAEFWIGSDNGVVSCLHESGINHYKQPYLLSKYINKFDPVYYWIRNGISEAYEDKMEVFERIIDEKKI